MEEEFASRRLRMQQELQDAEIDLAAIAPTANMRYLLGFAPLADERPCLLLATRDEMRLVVPALNAPQVEAHTGLTAMRWTDTEGAAWVLERALRELGIRDDATLLADDTMRADHLILLQEAVRPGRSLPAAEIMGRLREVKSDAELAALQRAAEQADRALLAGARLPAGRQRARGGGHHQRVLHGGRGAAGRFRDRGIGPEQRLPAP